MFKKTVPLIICLFTFHLEAKPTATKQNKESSLEALRQKKFKKTLVRSLAKTISRHEKMTLEEVKIDIQKTYQKNFQNLVAQNESAAEKYARSMQKYLQRTNEALSVSEVIQLENQTRDSLESSFAAEFASESLLFPITGAFLGSGPGIILLPVALVVDFAILPIYIPALLLMSL
ncbi:MAG: hypothetical protein R3A80_10270 [Bdellovibrionota bacterium]